MLPGGSELLLVIVIVLMLFGGKELPRLMRTLGRWSSVLRRSMNEIRREFNVISIEEELKEKGIAKKAYNREDPERTREDEAVRAIGEPEGNSGSENPYSSRLEKAEESENTDSEK